MGRCEASERLEDRGEGGEEEDLPDLWCLEGQVHAVCDDRGEEEGDGGGSGVGREGLQPGEGEVEGSKNLREGRE